MANLIGYLRGSRGEVSRLGSQDIQATLKTWNGELYAVLDKDGEARVSVNGNEVYRGNINRK